jgi:hypothetical protein
MKVYEPCKNRTEYLGGSLLTQEVVSFYFYTATAVNEINVERPLRHIYELGAWLVTQHCRWPLGEFCLY